MGIHNHIIFAPRLNHLGVLGLALQQEAKVVAIHCYLAHLGTAGLRHTHTHTRAHARVRARNGTTAQSNQKHPVRTFSMFLDVNSCCCFGGSRSSTSDCILQ